MPDSSQHTLRTSKIFSGDVRVTTNGLMFVLADHLRDTNMVEFWNSGKVAPSAQEWLENHYLKPSYDDAEPLLPSILSQQVHNNIGIGLVGGRARAMGKYYKQNKSKMLLDRLTCTDIAYSILVYESARDVWVKEIDKKLTCDTEEQR